MYVFLGGVFHELALHKYCVFYVDSARFLYQEALNYAPFDSTIAAWNLVDLYLSLFKHNKIALGKREFYISNAKRYWYYFQATAQDPEFNFKSCQNPIFKDMDLAFEGLDSWWGKELSNFKNFCNSSQSEE